MSPAMYPKYFDFSKDECAMRLRKYQLGAYAAVVTAFRAQGELNEEKKTILSDLSSAMQIPKERHKAEIRRAVNDEVLSTIAFQMTGKECESCWIAEGRKVFPSLSRPLPVSKYTRLADKFAKILAAENATKCHPSDTGKLDNFIRQASTFTQVENPEKTEVKEEVNKILEDATKRICSACKKSVGETVDASTGTETLPDHEYLWVTQGGKRRKRKHSFVYLPSGTIRVRSGEDETVEDNENIIKYEGSFNDFSSNPPEINLSGKLAKPRKKRPIVPAVIHTKDEDVASKESMIQMEEENISINTERLNESAKSLHKKESNSRPVQKYRRKIRPTSTTSYQPMPVQNSPVPPEHLYGMPASQRNRYKNDDLKPDLNYHDMTRSDAYTPSTFPLAYTGSSQDTISDSNRKHNTTERKYLQDYAAHKPRYTPARMSPYMKPLSGRKSISINPPGDGEIYDRPGRPFHIHKKDSSSFTVQSKAFTQITENVASVFSTNSLENLATASMLQPPIPTSTSNYSMDETGLAPVSAIVSRMSSPAPNTLPSLKVQTMSPAKDTKDDMLKLADTSLQFKVLPPEIKANISNASSEIKPKDLSNLYKSSQTETKSSYHHNLPNIQLNLTSTSNRSFAQKSVLKSTSGNIITVTAKTQPTARVTCSTTTASRSLTGQSKPSIIVVRSKPGSKLGKSSVTLPKGLSDKTKVITLGKHVNPALPSTNTDQANSLGSIQGLVSGLVSPNIVRMPSPTPKLITMPKRTLVSGNSPKVIQKMASGKVLVKSMPSVTMANLSVSSLAAVNRIRTLTAGQIIKPSGFQKTSKVFAPTLSEYQDQVDETLSDTSETSLTGSITSIHKPLSTYKPIDSFKPKLVFTSVSKSPQLKQQMKQIVVTSQGADVSFLSSSTKAKFSTSTSFFPKTTRNAVSTYLTASTSRPQIPKSRNSYIPSPQMQVKVFKPVKAPVKSQSPLSSQASVIKASKEQQEPTEGSTTSMLVKKTSLSSSMDRTTFIYHIATSASSTSTTQAPKESSEIMLRTIQAPTSNDDTATP